jgi:hypothetical protein
MDTVLPLPLHVGSSAVQEVCPETIQGFKDVKRKTKIGEVANADVIKEYYHEVFNQETSLQKASILHIKNCWQDSNCDFELGHTNILSLLCKGKEDS